MPATAPMTRKPHTTRMELRASFAKTVRDLALGLSVAVGVLGCSDSIMGQQCDRCSEPTCGCESSMPALKKCKPKCIPKPSFAEKIFSRLDKAGDAIEAKMAKKKSLCDRCAALPSCGCESNMGPSCGCEPAAPSCGCEPVAPTCGCENIAPSCGCESCSNANTAYAGQGMYYGQNQQMVAMPRNTTYPAPRANGIDNSGSIANPAPPPMQRPAPPIVRVEKPKAVNETAPANKQTLSDVATEPVLTNAPKAPFEKRVPSETNPRRIPADEQLPATLPSVSDAVIRTSPSPRIQNNAPKKSVPATLPESPEPALPDVLIDPFKDDASVRKTRDKMEGVLLTSDRRAVKSGIQLRAQNKMKAKAESSESEMPAPLTPEQRQVPKFQSNAVEPLDSNSSMVVPSSFQQMIPVTVTTRKKSKPIADDEEPSVPKIAVPKR
jgi:hypothetical protein